jgi:hypothetical protein
MADIFNLSDTWNDGATTFSAIKMDVTDTASASGSLLMDLQVGGGSRFSVKKNGDINIISGATVTSSNLIYFGGGGQTGINSAFSVNSQALTVNGAKYLGWGSNPAATADVQLYRDAADTLAQRRSTNPQAFRAYNTYTDASNYERGKIAWESNVLRIGTEKAGTGSARALELQTDGVTRVTIATTGAATFAQQILTQTTGNSANPVIAFTGDTDTGIFRRVANAISFSAGGVERVALGDKFYLPSAGEFVWYDNVLGAGGSTIDVGVKRSAAGQLQITDGSTGTGQLIFIVPTSDPGITGALWNNGGALAISA